MKSEYLFIRFYCKPITILAILLIGVLSLPYKASAQIGDELSNPQVTLNLKHPPGLGLLVNKIAFGPASGPCSDEIISALISHFVGNNVEVIDRQNLTSILNEHDFAFSGYVDQTSAAEMGKIIGPAVLVFVKIQRCTTIVDRLYDKESKYDYQAKRSYNVTAYYTRTRAFLKGSIQSVDLATGRIFAAQAIDFSPEEKFKSYEGYPEAPSEFDLRDRAIRMFVNNVHRMYLPWTERTSLYYFDDKTCDLKQAYQAVAAGDLDYAFDLSMKNLENCKTTPNIKDKNIAHAYYNMGMSYMIRQEYDQALVNFREAAKLRPGSIVNETIADCQRAKELMTAMQKVEESASIESDKVQIEEKKLREEEATNTMTNKDIIVLSQKKVPDTLIIQKIKTSKCKFSTNTDAIIELTSAGVSQEVILVMMER